MTLTVITGMGAVCCLGDSVEELWEGLLDGGRSRPGRADDTPVEPGQRYRVTAGPPYRRDDPEGLHQRNDRGGRRAGRSTAMALAAVGQAVADAGLSPEQLADAGLTVGTTLGDIDIAESVDDREPVDLYQVAAMVADRYAIGGPNHTVSTACSAGAYAVSLGAELIESGQADVVVVCGADTHSRVAVAALDRLGLLDHEMSRPFDAHRRGMVPGDGAAAVVLESTDHARHRGARRYAELEGHGWSCDGHHPTAPEPDGRQLRRAIAEALGTSAGPPGVVLPHRAGIAVNDTVECDAVADALGERTGSVPAYAVKALIGHTAGGAGVFACVAGALMLRHRRVPANANLSTPDPRSALFAPVDGPVPLGEARVLVTATGFGGNNAALVLGAGA